MKKEVTIYASVVLLMILIFAVAYIFNLKLTGFAIFQQNAQADFDQGTYDNTFYNGSAIVLNLSTNTSQGTYTSKVFDAANNSSWNNLTWQDAVPENTTLTIQVKNCSSSSCSAESFFVPTNLSNLNLTSQYFQYEIIFNSNNTNVTPYLTSVSVGYSPLSAQTNATNQTPTTLIISQPSGTKTSGTNISIQFNVTGQNLTCGYNVLNSTSNNNSFVVSNTTLPGCSNSTFTISNVSGNYIFNLYANGSSGFASVNSTFSLSVSSSQNTTTINTTNTTTTTTQTNTTTEITTNTTTLTQQPQQPTQPAVSLTLSDISTLNLKSGDYQDVKITAKNDGTNPLTACVLKSDSSLLLLPEESNDIASGASKDYTFVINIPSNASDSSSKENVSVTCKETSESKDFTVNVERIKIGFNATSIERTSSGRVRVIYTLQEFTNSSQNVTLDFSLLNESKTEISNLSQNETLKADQTKTLIASLPINSSTSENATLDLTIQYKSSVYSGTYEKSFVLGVPSGGILSGFAVLGDLGTGSVVLLIGIICIVVVIFVIIRRLKKNKE